MRVLAALLLAAPLVATGAPPAFAQTPAASADGSRFRVLNRTGEVAIGLYAADPGQEGRNLIAGQTMRPGQAAQITRTRPGCVVDVRLVTASGQVFDRRGVDVCASEQVVFGSAAAQAQSQAQSQAQGAVSSETVSRAQQSLALLGYDTGGADGQLGPRTQSAIAAFQRDRSLPATGQLDGQTLAALGNAAGATRAQSPSGQSPSGQSPPGRSPDGKPPPAAGRAPQPAPLPQQAAPQQAARTGKPPPAVGPDRPEPIPGGRVVALPNPGAPPNPGQQGQQQGQPPRQQGALRRASTGTGFVVAEGRIVTNHHVIDGCSALNGLIAGGRRVPLQVQASNRERDLALLTGPRDIGPVLAFRDGPPRRGDEVVTYGFPLTGILGSGPTLTTGEVSALTGLRDDPNTMIISAPVQSGNSGGPLLDRSGNVLGVIVAKLNALRVAERTGGDLPQNVNIAIQGRVAQAFLRENGVTPRAVASSGYRPAAEVGEIAHPSTLLIECMK
ncbi:serine protease [Elioraea sp.]|uniref:serine protease n=1 Tax=Elioraea sp. TaxID=2185103 RepID=UPI0025BA924C|nr:serine protease [Elioraea sp.]